jgi:hypothetical protein
MRRGRVDATLEELILPTVQRHYTDNGNDYLVLPCARRTLGIIRGSRDGGTPRLSMPRLGLLLGSECSRPKESSGTG